MEEIISFMRATDVREIISTGVPIREGVTHTWNTACEAYAGIVNGKLVTVFGVSRLNVLSDHVAPWNLSTEEIDKYQFAFARRNKAIVNEWRGKYRLMKNYVHVNNKLSIRWLKWLGFYLHHPVELGQNGELFYPFTMRGF